TYFPKDAPPALPEHPHCYSGDTEVYTNKGWQYFQDLKGDELILALNPNNFDLQYLPIKHQIEYPFKGKMISFKNRGFDLLVTTKHRMYVGKRSCAYDRKKKKFRFIEAEDLNGEYYIYRSSDWQGKNKKFIEIADKKIKTEVFCKFMGWYLSEGNSSKRKGFNSWQTVISQHGKKLKKMQKDLAKLPYKVNNFNGGVRIYDEQLGKYLRQFGKSNEKFIPEEIKELSSKYIRLFLDSYLAGDGNERKAKKWKNGKFKNEKVYFTASKKMADDIGELILKVGHRPSYYLQKSKGISKKHKNGTYIGNFDLWRIRECYRQYATKIRKSEEYYDGKVYDVELPKWHVLYVRRNGKCCWSGNCMCWLELVLKKG
ncbi:MAG: hypothetical protein KGY74_05355, partial [Candidatus Cloacimonetes bacterium]|nr:hypothetical protein [Candidatus Cloacimonadota bacterium]